MLQVLMRSRSRTIKYPSPAKCHPVTTRSRFADASIILQASPEDTSNSYPGPAWPFLTSRLSTSCSAFSSSSCTPPSAAKSDQRRYNQAGRARPVNTIGTIHRRSKRSAVRGPNQCHRTAYRHPCCANRRDEYRHRLGQRRKHKCYPCSWLIKGAEGEEYPGPVKDRGQETTTW